MKKRTLALLAAYKTLEEGFAKYRGRVIEEYGEEKDKDFRYGIKKQLVTETVVDPETGKKTKVKSDQFFGDGSEPGIYAVYVGKNTSTQWDNDFMDLNERYIFAQRDWANHLLHKNGHVFLNDVLHLLGIKGTPDGQLVGWLDNKARTNSIEFYVKKLIIQTKDGAEEVFLVDFNVTGEPIFAQI